MSALTARVAAVVLTAAALTTVSAPSDAALRRHYKPCATEDSPGPCVWDAKHRGNGVGRSFVVTRNQNVVYVSHARAHRMAAKR